MRVPVVVLIAALPIFFIGLGLWETERGRTTRANTQAVELVVADRPQIPSVPDPRALADDTAAEGQWSSATPSTGDRDGADAAETTSMIAEWRERVAWSTLGGGALALAAGWSGLLLVARSARRGTRSRQHLVSGFARVSRILPPLLAVQILALVSATISAVVFEISALWFVSDPSDRAVLLALVVSIIACLVLWGAFQVLRDILKAWRSFVSKPMDIVALPLTSAQAPGLFALLSELAAERGALEPRTIAVGAHNGFFATARPMQLFGSSDERLTIEGPALHLSLPVLAILDREELRVVLAHELAHFAGEDTAYGVRFAPLFSALGEAATAMSLRQTDWGSTTVDRLFEQVVHPHTALAVYAYERFDHAAMHWSRLRELEADRAAVASGSPPALASALLRIGLAYDLLRADCRTLAERPQAVLDLAASLVDRMAGQTAADVAPYLSDNLSHPSDTHPPTRSRIEAVGIPIDEALLLRSARPVATVDAFAIKELFADWKGLNEELNALLQERAVRARHERKALLTETAERSGGAGETAVYPSVRRLMSLLSLIGILCLSFSMGCVWAAFYGGTQDQESRPLLLSAATLFSLGFVFVARSALRLWRGRQQPYLSFDRLGFRSPGLVETIRWVDVVFVGSSVAGRPSLWFQIGPDAQMPESTGRMRRMIVDQTTRSVQFQQVFPRGMQNAALQELLLSHARSAHAERQLELFDRGDQHLSSPDVR